MIFFSFPTRSITHFFTDTQSKTKRVGEKEQVNKHDLGSAPSTRKEVCDTVHSLCIVDYRGRVFCTKLLQATINADIFPRWLTRPTGLSSRLSDFCWFSSLLYLHFLTASFCWLSHSRDSYLEPTGLFFPALSTALSNLLSNIPFFLHLRSRRRSRPQSFVLVSRQNVSQ